MSKKILVVGNGAREHAICKAILRSPQDAEVVTISTANNPGILDLAKEVYVVDSLLDFDFLKEVAQKEQPDFAIIGPDDPIAMGASDALLELGIKSVAPTKSLARLESSKSFTRNLLDKYEIRANPDFRVFTSEEGMMEYAESLGKIVVKYDGLAGGKGVKVQDDHFKTIEEGVRYAKECLRELGVVVIEEKLEGQEFSAMFFADGVSLKKMPIIQDNKRAFEDDKGENTGGMGTVSDVSGSLPFLTEQDTKEAEDITFKVMQALEKECGERFKGIMYGGFIATKNGVRLIEYNARFGDPEAMNALCLLEGDFVEICEAVINEGLDKIEVGFEEKATVCKYIVPEGYPENPVKNKAVEIDYDRIPAGIEIHFASVDEQEGVLYLKGSRAIAFVAKADDIYMAEKMAEEACSSVKGAVFHRTDIGTRTLIEKKIKHMKCLRA
ncbi:MAG: phosphoribosylamine--glycine ligase [Candidatus Gracilibacteria bacterium]|jgi:phosphoribosylamine--glycine ligase|nr:phosphoribosylamine--glycine ligase [Candidatus Gracilibacteria bacterium]